MEFLSSWFQTNWFPLCQSAGIIGGLLFTAISVRQDRKARELTDFLTVNESHRQTWRQLYTQPGLERITSRDPDLVAQPMSTAEEFFLNEAFLHFYTGWKSERMGSQKTVEASDVRYFFELPIPKKVWNETKTSRDPEFVKFIEKTLSDS